MCVFINLNRLSSGKEYRLHTYLMIILAVFVTILFIISLHCIVGKREQKYSCTRGSSEE